MVQPEFRLENLGSQAVLLKQGQKAQGLQFMNGPVLTAPVKARPLFSPNSFSSPVSASFATGSQQIDRDWGLLSGDSGIQDSQLCVINNPFVTELWCDFSWPAFKPGNLDFFAFLVESVNGGWGV